MNIKTPKSTPKYSLKTTPKLPKKSTTIECRQISITLSQSKLPDSEYIFNKIIQIETQKGHNLLQHLSVVKETHTNDPEKGIHFHIYLSWKKVREITLRYFDYLQPGAHLEKVKNKNCLLKYMSKENIPNSNFDYWQTLLDDSKTCAQTLINMQRLGWKLDDIQLKYKYELVNKNFSKIRLYINEITVIEEKASQPEPIPLRYIDRALIELRLPKNQLKIFDSFPLYSRLVEIINNLKKYNFDHPHKQCCVSLLSKPSMGKTSLIINLARHYHTYIVPTDGWHQSRYENYHYTIWHWDEWSINQVPFTDFLLLTEGLYTDLRIKGSKAFKKDRPMLFLTSNDSWKEQYKRKQAHILRQSPKTYELQYQAIDTRIEELDFQNNSLLILQNLLVSINEDINPKYNPIKFPEI